MSEELIEAFRRRMVREDGPALYREIEEACQRRREERGGHAAWGRLCEEVGLVNLAYREWQLAPADFERQRQDAEAILAEGPEGGEGGAAPAEPGVFLNAAGRRIFLNEFFGRLREALYYPPRNGSFELRSIIREQAYLLARVIEGEEPGYRAFVPA